jgi:hypothetical protein
MNRRKSSSAILVDRRKSYIDVAERVLGDTYLRDFPVIAAREIASRAGKAAPARVRSSVKAATGRH